MSLIFCFDVDEPIALGDVNFFDPAINDCPYGAYRTMRDEAPVFWDPVRIEQLLGNLLENSLRYTDAPGQVWVSDITYIPTGEGWLYLAIVLDLYSRKIVGWSISDRICPMLSRASVRSPRAISSAALSA